MHGHSQLIVLQGKLVLFIFLFHLLFNSWRTDFCMLACFLTKLYSLTNQMFSNAETDGEVSNVN